MDTVSSSNSNSSIGNGEVSGVSEGQWKAEEAIGFLCNGRQACPHSVHRAHAAESEKIAHISLHLSFGFLDVIQGFTRARCSSSFSSPYTAWTSINPHQVLYHKLLWLHQLNRVDAIDPALRKSGRFNDEVEVTTPNEEGFQILKADPTGRRVAHGTRE
ncbi:hypothetical protein F3Y22_tig00109958pilonHSYRG00004 [Hibiscus syriacus]|uniref:Uncharacterized protein n=1 Tax=Hibiscus syriacus TaxID=106335 RepID=A0A6A3BR64_HIBSY|nr:hypothetical protein F3Y22_tig00109958pilonHSYRG00004 [Hibiscus syriacus]